MSKIECPHCGEEYRAELVDEYFDKCYVCLTPLRKEEEDDL